MEEESQEMMERVGIPTLLQGLIINNYLQLLPSTQTHSCQDYAYPKNVLEWEIKAGSGSSWA